MDYKEEYQKALERAKKGLPIDEVFPELKESEDERIRKEILDFIKSFWADHKESIPRISSWLAYLEKQKEQKPSPSIYWHAIKKGDTLPCRAYLWTPEYEKYYDCFEGRLIPTVENVTSGADMWYLPVDDIQTLPREGIDELPKEQKPESCDCSRDEESYTNGIHHVLMNPEAYGLIKQKPAEQLGGTFTSYDMAKTFTEGQNYVIAHPEKFGLCKPAEWSEEDDNALVLFHELISFGYTERFCDAQTAEDMRRWLNERLKSLRPQPHWKPSKVQMKALNEVANDGVLLDLFNDLLKLL